MTLTTLQVTRWLRPWPIRLEKASWWRFRVVPLRACARLAAFWHLDAAHPVLRSVGWWAAKAARGKMGEGVTSGHGPGHQHYIHMLARFRVPVLPSLTILVIWRKKERRWVVVDGNNHLIAALLVAKHRWRRLRTRLTHVGVLVRVEPGRKTWTP